MVNPCGELVGAVALVWRGLKEAIRRICQRHELIHQIDRGRIHARQRNCAIRKDVSIIRPGNDRCRGRGCTTCPRIQDIGHMLVRYYALKRTPGEITRSLGSSGNSDRIRRNTVYKAPTFIRTEEEGLIFLDRTTQRPTKLVLLEIRFLRIKEPARVKHLVAEK